MPLEHDQDRARRPALGVALEHVDDPGRLRVRGQEAALPGRGDVADVGPPDQAGDPEQDPDPDRSQRPGGPVTAAASLSQGGRRRTVQPQPRDQL